MIRQCRRCRTPKWGTDPCVNAFCPTVTEVTVRLRAKTRPVTVTAKHGYHAPTTGFVQIMQDYDAPIRTG